MKYESTILKRLIDTYGVVGNPRYISEIIKEFIVRGKESFPNLFTYQSDWLAHIDEFGLNPTYTVSYTGQSIYAPNTLEKPIKSAILKGNTLVNVLTEGQQNITTDKGHIDYFIGQNLKANTVYTAIFQVETEAVHLRVGITQSQGTWNSNNMAYTNGYNKVLLTTTVETAYSLRIRHNDEGSKAITASNVMLIEGDHTNVDIPYFEGMASVKMPVLTTTGKNLFNENLPLENGYIDGNGNKTSSALYEWINQEHFVDGGEPLIISYKNRVGNATVRLAEYGETGFIKRTNLANNKAKITLTANTKRVILSVDKGTTYLEELQIEYGTVATIYEPYKTNILTVNEEVELGSVGEAKDELNLLTGKLTQRTETRAYQEGDESNSEVLTDMTNTRYKLPKESIKTVDLTIHDKEHQKVERLTTFKGGTHFTTSSQDGSLLPSLTVDVVTDLEEILMVCSSEGNTM